MTLLVLLTFLAVSLGVLATGFVWSEIRRRDEMRAVQRLGEELKPFAKVSAAAAPLFKSVNEFDLGDPLSTAGNPVVRVTDPFVDSAPAVAPARSSFRPAALVPLLRDLLQQAELRLTLNHFCAISAAVAAALAIAAFLAQGWLLAVVAVPIGACLPLLYLRSRLHARRDKLLRQLPPAFDLMARVLRAGLSMPQAFQSIAEAFENPIAGEFARCRDEQNLGIFPEVSFRAMAERTGVLEMKIFVMAMLIQRQTGGNLSEVLERLAALIRERLRLRNHIRTLTAEGRLQAGVLLVLPFVMFFVMRVINKPYTDVLLDHPSWLAATGGLMAVGALWIRKTIDIE